MAGLIFGGAYLRREICILKSIVLACSGKEIYHFCFVLLCIRGQIPSTSPPGGLYSEGRFNGGFFALRVWGAYIWRGLYMEGLIFRILRYVIKLCFFILCVECLNAPNFLLVSICVCMFPFLTEWSFSPQIFYTVLSDFCANLAKAHILHVQWI